MKNISYIIAPLFIIIWALQFFIYDSEYMVHYLLAAGLVLIFARVIPLKSNYKTKNRSNLN